MIPMIGNQEIQCDRLDENYHQAPTCSAWDANDYTVRRYVRRSRKLKRLNKIEIEIGPV